ncbi:hypothetical protein NXU95_06210 [Phocaeicola vulgatus]|nr:hypothetical protein [Phocaeicola vulgatus]
MKYFSNFEHSLYNKESMDIIQVIIFIIIIVAAIVQQISKTGKEKKTPSPKKVLADIFPEIEQENIEEDLPVSSVQTVRTPQTPRMQASADGQETNRFTPEREQKGRPDSYKTEY